MNAALVTRLDRRAFLTLAVSAVLTSCGGANDAVPASRVATPAGAPASSPPSRSLVSQTSASSVAPAPSASAAPVATPSPTVTAGPSLTYISGSSAKVEQLLGDFDKQTKKPTLNLTQTRYGITGTDLGNSFEHNGKVYFLFGDVPDPGAPDPMGYSESTDPTGQLALQFLSAKAGSFVPVKPPNVSMGPFEVPVAGISLNGTMFVVVSTGYTPERNAEKSLLTRFDETARTFTTVREISHLPNGRFIKMTLRPTPQGLTGLPGTGAYVLVFGSGVYRKSNAYLAAVPAQSFSTGDGTRYLAGLSGAEPRWSDKEEDAVPIVTHPTIGDLSVTFLDQVGLWVMTYDSRDPQGVILRYAQKPWGPWSDAAVIFNDQRDHALGTFIHDPRIKPDDGLAGPVIGAKDAAAVSGGTYAPYIIERFTRIEGNMLTLHYVLSTWNPYTVVRMRSTLALQR